MNFNKVYVTGDFHANFNNFFEFMCPCAQPQNEAIIILGDASINYFNNDRDLELKEKLDNCGYVFYLVRGNHEMRPENLHNVIPVYDPRVNGNVFVELGYSNIHYFIDGEDYIINGHSFLVVGGAYSVDKPFRLLMNRKWFEDEQPTEREMNGITAKTKGKKFDFVLTHTCPYSWQPIDLFVTNIDQATVDNTMEKWLDDLKDKIEWGIWLFGHYHADRIERPNVEMYYNEIEEIETIYKRWHTGDLPLLEGCVLSPSYDMV